MIRLATYNIRKFVGGDGKWNPERVVGVIRALNADVLSIQEFVVDPREKSAPSAEQFAAAAGYRMVEQRIRRRNGEDQSNLLLTRAPPRDVRLIPLKFPHVEERGAICAGIETGAQILRVAATHLGLPPITRYRQLRAIVKACGQGREPFALIGDLNVVFSFEPAVRLLRSAFPVEGGPRTFPARRPLLALDRIALRGMRLHTLRAHDEGAARLASDHLPLMADADFA